jgi:hypothetical protein
MPVGLGAAEAPPAPPVRGRFFALTSRTAYVAGSRPSKDGDGGSKEACGVPAAKELLELLKVDSSISRASSEVTGNLSQHSDVVFSHHPPRLLQRGPGRLEGQSAFMSLPPASSLEQGRKASL